MQEFTCRRIVIVVVVQRRRRRRRALNVYWPGSSAMKTPLVAQNILPTTRAILTTQLQQQHAEADTRARARANIRPDDVLIIDTFSISQVCCCVRFRECERKTHSVCLRRAELVTPRHGHVLRDRVRPVFVVLLPSMNSERRASFSIERLRYNYRRPHQEAVHTVYNLYYTSIRA